MGVRKIQHTRSGSFFITLPKAWVTDQEIGKGEELIITFDEDGALKINTLKTQKRYYSEFIVQIEDYTEENSLERCIKSSYIQGSDIISIISKNTIVVERKNIIEKATSNLIGTEVSEEFSNKITIRVLVDPVRFPLHILIRRIYTLVHSMHVDAIKSFTENDEVLAKDVINREKQVAKLYFLMLRQLNLSLSNRLNFEEICTSELKIDCVFGIVLARDLGKMAHYAVVIANQVIRLKDKKITSELKEHLKKMSSFVVTMQQNAILAFFKENFMRANRVINSITEVIAYDLKTEQEVLKKVDDVGMTIGLITISRNLRNIANSAVDVSEDLQVKHRPKTTIKRELGAEQPVDPLELI
ncbi:MAG: phosphate uptake regulator PhoU [Candidatus Helarchaeota archaeon]|nr:phosphate uptake regulator PhoU [Candidatus Helarchaeota archaeon]